MTFKLKHAEKKKKDDNCLFLQDYFIIFDEIIKPYCSGSQTKVPVFVYLIITYFRAT